MKMHPTVNLDKAIAYSHNTPTHNYVVYDNDGRVALRTTDELIAQEAVKDYKLGFIEIRS